MLQYWSNGTNNQNSIKKLCLSHGIDAVSATLSPKFAKSQYIIYRFLVVDSSCIDQISPREEGKRKKEKEIFVLQDRASRKFQKFHTVQNPSCML